MAPDHILGAYWGLGVGRCVHFCVHDSPAVADGMPAHAREPAYDIERNATLETVQIMVLLAPSWKTPNIGVRPLADEAKKHFAPLHPTLRCSSWTG